MLKFKSSINKTKISHRICFIYSVLICFGVFSLGQLVFNAYSSNKKETFKDHIDILSVQKSQLLYHNFAHIEANLEMLEMILEVTKDDRSQLEKWIAEIFKTNVYVVALKIYPVNGSEMFLFNNENLDPVKMESLQKIFETKELNKDIRDESIYSLPITLDDADTKIIKGYKELYVQSKYEKINWGSVEVLIDLAVVEKDLIIVNDGEFDYEYRYILGNEQVIYTTAQDPLKWETYYTLPLSTGNWYLQAYLKNANEGKVIIFYMILLLTALFISLLYFFQHIRLLSKSDHIDSLNVKLKNLLITDHLTSVKNRWGVYEYLESFMPYARRNSIPLSVAMLDIDDFKCINDQLGHAGGDQALKYFADKYQKRIRQSDILGRFGGDEFICVFTDCDIKNSTRIAEVLKTELNEKPFKYDGNEIKIAFSMGISQLESDDDTVEELVNRADKALYEAKSAGKNRIFSKILPK